MSLVGTDLPPRRRPSDGPVSEHSCRSHRHRRRTLSAVVDPNLAFAAWLHRPPVASSTTASAAQTERQLQILFLGLREPACRPIPPSSSRMENQQSEDQLGNDDHCANGHEILIRLRRHWLRPSRATRSHQAGLFIDPTLAHAACWFAVSLRPAVTASGANFGYWSWIGGRLRLGVCRDLGFDEGVGVPLSVAIRYLPWRAWCRYPDRGRGGLA